MRSYFKKNEKWILCLVVIMHSFILYYICDFSKTLETYQDELIYFNLAKCLSEGKNFIEHGVRRDFTNIAYSLIICPVFWIKDIFVSVHLITIINAVLMSVSIVPVWLLCKELGVHKKITWSILLIIMIYPSMNFAATFMAENLYWPLTLFCYYFIVKTIKHRKTSDAFIVGILSFLCYFCKEVGVVIFLSYTIWYFISPVDSYFFEYRFSQDTRESFVKYYIKQFEWKNILTYIFTYAIFYLIVNKFFLSTVINNYGGVSGTITSFLESVTLSQLVYILYAIIVYVVYAIIAFMVIPIILPLIKIKEISHVARKTYIFTLILFMGTIFTIVCTISVKESFGMILPRIHMRYFSSMIGLILPVFGSMNFNKMINKSQKSIWIFLGIFWIVAVYFFKGVSIGSCVDCIELGYPIYLHRKYGVISIGELKIYIAGIVYNILGGMIIVLGYFLSKIKMKYTYYLFYIFAILICILNFWMGFHIIKRSYYVAEAHINNMKQINDYFINNQLENKNVMFVCNNWYDKGPKVYDTYFQGRKSYLVSNNTLIDTLNNTSSKYISDYIFVEPIQEQVFQLKDIDYFIVENIEFQNLIGNIEYMEDISSEDFSVFKNINPSEIYYLKQSNIIDFTGRGHSSVVYRIEGISVAEGTFSWTEGNKLSISCDFPQEVEHLRAQINIVGTFNGIQKFAVYQNDMPISEGSISDSGQIIVDLNVVDGVCNFNLDLPNAISPYECGVSEDKRVLALAISSIEFFENE